MTFYHGTTLDAAKQIQREGLKPGVNHFSLRLDDGTLMPKRPYVYLNPYLEIAEDYARFRAIYERATKGQAIPLPEHIGAGLVYTKLAGYQHPNAKPAIVRLDIPLGSIPLQEDPDSYYGRVCKCVIPSHYIVNIAEVSL